MSEPASPTSPEPFASPETAHQPPRSVWSAPSGECRHGLSVDELRRIVKSGEGQLWVDIDVRVPAQVALLRSLFGFHPLTIEDCENPASRVKLEEYPGYLFLIIRGVRFDEQTDDPYDLETYNINFYVGPAYVVTVHGGQSLAIADVHERLRKHPDLLAKGAERLAHAIMDSAVDEFFPLLDTLDDFIDSLEDRVFRHFDRSSLRDIFAVKRVVLTLRRHLAPQREVFNVLTNRPSALLSPDVQIYFRDVYDHVLRITDSLETYRELLSSTLDSFLTQQSNRLGQITKGLSVIATVSLPFVVISGMWGMNVENIPLSHHPHAFGWMLGIQAAVGIVLLVLLRKHDLL